MGRSPSCDDNGLKKGPWAPEEDKKLVHYIEKHGYGSWRALPKLAGLNRCGKSCRLRWTNYLRPDIKRGKFSTEEEQTILNLHSVLGNKWSAIATHLPGRTDNEIKNFWNTHLKKKLIQMGFDPMTHRPRTDIFANLPHLIALANLKEMMDNTPWDEQAIKLQEAIQLARVQFLRQILLQSNHSIASPPANTLHSAGFTTDLDVVNLLNSTFSPSSPSTTPPRPIYSNDSSNNGFSSDLSNNDQSQSLYISQQKAQYDYQPAMGIEVHGSNYATFSQEETRYGSPVMGHPEMAENVSGDNEGDAYSIRSYTGNESSFWPELLLEDPFLHELA